MRVAITGVTGNVGTALVAALGAGAGEFAIVGIARRVPDDLSPYARFVAADLATGDLAAAFAGVDAVVHLAWEIQPSRDRRRLWRTNVLGTRRVLDAVRAAGVPRLVYASSIGVYGPGPKEPVDESWRRDGIATSTYSTHKAETERLLDGAEALAPGLRVIRMRPALIFQTASATEQRRLFAGPFVPRRLLRRGVLPLMPDIPGLRFQAVHADDVAEAYRLALTAPEAHGAYNVAAPPVLDMPAIARARGARTVTVPRRIARPAFAAAYALRLQPSEPSWLDLALDTPLVSPARIERELGWHPRHGALEAIEEAIDGMAAGAGGHTPPLAPDRGLLGRLREVAEGVGSRGVGNRR